MGICLINDYIVCGGFFPVIFNPDTKNEILWASVREIYNIVQANECGCDIVTVPHDILNKSYTMIGKNLDELSLDTVKMFYSDAVSAGFNL